MKRSLIKWIGIGLGGLLAVAALAAAGLYLSAGRRLHHIYAIPAEPLSLQAGQADLANGRRLVTTRCASCHGENLAGSVLFQDPSLATITAPNLTGGRGNGGQLLNDEDYVRAIRHGVGHDGQPLLVMPSDAFYYLSDQDLGEMIAYLKTTPPVENPLPETSVRPLGVVLIGAGVFGKLMPAEEINHQAPRPAAAAPGATASYGEYLVRTGQCRTCHGPQLTGGKDPDPAAPPAPDLTRRGELAGWSEADFAAALRTGVTPGGRTLNPNMPWKYLGHLTDDEVQAIWLYLQSLPAQSASK